MTTDAPVSAPPPSASAPLLSIQNLVVRYGAIEALHGVSLRVLPGQIVTLIGANGAGKSSLLRAISGLVPAQAGTIDYTPAASPSSSSEDATARSAGERTSSVALHATPPHRIVALGIAHVPEGRGIFLNMTVQENLELGAYLRRDHAGIAADRERVFKLFPRIRERRAQLAGTMSRRRAADAGDRAGA